MSQWQPEDPYARPPATPPQWARGNERPPMPMHVQPQYPPQPRPPVQRHPGNVTRMGGLTAAGAFWYVLGCIPMGAMYFAKVPAKKALQDAGMARMTSAEQFWYVLMCIGFGAGYFAKLPIAKALSEMPR